MNPHFGVPLLPCNAYFCVKFQNICKQGKLITISTYRVSTTYCLKLVHKIHINHFGRIDVCQFWVHNVDSTSIIFEYTSNICLPMPDIYRVSPSYCLKWVLECYQIRFQLSQHHYHCIWPMADYPILSAIISSRNKYEVIVYHTMVHNSILGQMLLLQTKVNLTWILRTLRVPAWTALLNVQCTWGLPWCCSMMLSCCVGNIWVKHGEKLKSRSRTLWEHLCLNCLLHRLPLKHSNWIWSSGHIQWILFTHERYLFFLGSHDITRYFRFWYDYHMILAIFPIW